MTARSHIGGDGDHALAVLVLDLGRALAHRDVGDLAQRHHQVAAGHGDRQVLDVAGADAVIRMQAQRHIARFAGRVDPVTDLDAGKSQ